MMRKLFIGASLIVVAAAVPSIAYAAAGTPQRSDETPPGLSRVMERGTPGIIRALIATEGSNSRLQDVPVSP